MRPDKREPLQAGGPCSHHSRARLRSASAALRATRPSPQIQKNLQHPQLDLGHGGVPENQVRLQHRHSRALQEFGFGKGTRSTQITATAGDKTGTSAGCHPTWNGFNEQHPASSAQFRGADAMVALADLDGRSMTNSIPRRVTSIAARSR